MKEQIHTIPVNEAFEAVDECPFCNMERAVEQSAIRYVLGPAASYMEPDVRGATDQAGFCGVHMKKMYDYGNTLGNALILQTYYARLLDEFHLAAATFEMPPKQPILGKKKPMTGDRYWQRLQQRVDSCYICDRIEENQRRYFATFFALIKEKAFREKVERSKGFCLGHFGELLDKAQKYLPNDQREWFYETIPSLMKNHMNRMKEDIDWFVQKHDYRFHSEPWYNSKDAVPRGMQKLRGGHPSDKPYKTDF